MIQDLNKGIPANGISYNHLNLPKQILFSGTPARKINYLYNALGQKVQKKVTDGTAIITTNYISGFHYENNALKFFATAEGYVNVIIMYLGTQKFTNFNYVYNYTDHLGNIRLSYTNNSVNGITILEENHYYPFGLKHKKYGSVDKDFIEIEGQGGYYVGIDIVSPQARKAYQYKYNSHEWQDELGLNWDSFKWRNYDFAIGRFMSIDPLAEKYAYNSPYAFQENKMGLGRELEGLELERLRGGLKDISNGLSKVVDEILNPEKGMEKNGINGGERAEVARMQSSEQMAKGGAQMATGASEAIKGGAKVTGEIMETTGDVVTVGGIVTGLPLVVAAGEVVSGFGLTINAAVDSIDGKSLLPTIVKAGVGMVFGGLSNKGIEATQKVAGREAVEAGANKVSEAIIEGTTKAGEIITNELIVPEF
ncbi:MAG TPA: hypothetical protein VLZ11_03915 [Flavobacterium sp.]|nr:hypothetical protein [Flavobacterium sp.]